jgi:phosphoribosylformylglycinamidine synthase
VSAVSGAKKVAIVVFPGTNCESDIVLGLKRAGIESEKVWHKQGDLSDFDAVVIPGGFAFGDYLRPGAIARFSPIMSEVLRLAAKGAPVLGICNGFQVLTEAGLLPGALQKNAGLSFICKTVELEVTSSSSNLTSQVAVGERLRIPINHFEGNFTASKEVIEELESTQRVVLRYLDNPNGSMNSIAGITNVGGNVVGLMPHPERASDPLRDETDGLKLLQGFVDSL